MTEMTDIIEDVSLLTTINKRNLNKLIDVAQYCINEAIEESLIESKTTSDINIGIGELHIQFLNNELKFKFIPSAKLREGIIDTIKGKQNSLELVLEHNLVDKITNVYKEII